MKKVALTMLAAVIAFAMASTNVLAAKDKAAKKPGGSVAGTLAVVKGADGKVTGTTITTKSGTVYTLAGLTQDVTALDGKEVTAKGEVKDEAGVMTLTVNGLIKAAVEKKAKKEKPAAAAEQ